MSAPNIVNVTTITGKTSVVTLSTSTANVVTNSANSNSIVKLNNIVLSNFAATTVTANVVLNRSSINYYLGGTVAIPPNSTLILLGKDTSIYLEEGDVIQANVSANSSVSFTGSYEIIS